MKENLRRLLLGGFDVNYKRICLCNLSNVRRPGQKCFQVSDYGEKFTKIYYDIDDAIDQFLTLYKRVK